MSTHTQEIAREAQSVLTEHTAACEHAYKTLVEENRLLKLPEPALTEEFLEAKREALSRLDRALENVRGLSSAPGSLSAADRGAIQKTQQLVLKALLLDRENEQLLRKSTAPKKSAVPTARPTLDQIQRLYKKHSRMSESEEITD